MIMPEAPREQAPNHKPISIKPLLTLPGDVQWARTGQVAEFSVCVRRVFRVRWQGLKNWDDFIIYDNPKYPLFRFWTKKFIDRVP